MNNTYAKAYTEVLEIIKYLPKEEYNKIPKQKIKYYQKYKDIDYNYIYDNSKSPNEQEISRKANAIIITLFRDYFAAPIQKEKLQKILKQNEQKYQDKIREIYNPNNLFKKENQDKNENVEENKQIIEYKNENIFDKILKKFKRYIIGIFK